MGSIVVDFYEGAYGPTIHVAISCHEDLLRLLDLFSRLGAGMLVGVEFCEFLEVRPTGLESLRLHVAGREGKKTVSRTKTSSSLAAFNWSRARSGWDWCAGQIEGLLEDDEPGHQYLSSDSVDDVLIEVSYREHQ